MKRTSKKKQTKQPNKKSKNLVQNKKSNNAVLLYGLLAGAVVFAMSYLFLIPDDVTLMQLSQSKNTFTFIAIILSGLVFYGIYKIEDKRTGNILKYTFLALLLYSISISLIPVKEYSQKFVILYHTFTAFQKLLIAPTIALGVLSVWIYRAKVQDVVNKLFSKQEERKTDLSVKEKFLNPITNLFSKKEVFFTAGLFVVIGISIFTLFYKLDYFDLFSDEAQVTEGAAGYYKTGEYKYWDFIKNKGKEQKYQRAKPHQFIVAQSYKIFGISNWSSRFPSAVFGVLLIIISYFIFNYFIKDKLAILLVLLSFTFFVEFLFLQRWTRMYAMLLPFFVLEFFIFYKFITEKNVLKYLKIKKNGFIDKYINFNYIYLLPLLLLIYLNYSIHINSVLIFPVFLLFSVFSFIATKEKKYLIVVIIGILLLTVFIIFPYKINFNQFSFFKVKNFGYYYNAFFGYPFNTNANLIILVIIIVPLFIVKNINFKKTYLVLFASSITGLVLFSFILTRYEAFKYMSFIAPFSIFMIISSYFLIFRILFNKKLLFLLSFLIISSILIHFNRIYEDIYIRNFASPAKPTIAWQSIVKNYKKGEIIGRHWGPTFYFSGIDTSATFFSLGGDKGRPFNDIYNIIRNYKSGWLTWHTHFSAKMNKTLIEYANTYMQKLHGHKLDKTGVEVYYFNDSLLADTVQFSKDRLFPVANLNIQKTYSIAFWVKTTKETEGNPFSFTSIFEEPLNLTFINTESQYLSLKYKSINDSIKINIEPDNSWHHVVWYQHGGKLNDKFGLYFDGKLIGENKLSSEINSLIKFKINKYFKGIIDGIRIYDFVINTQQIKTIIKNRNQQNSEKLIVDDKVFETLYLWQKRN